MAKKSCNFNYEANIKKLEKYWTEFNRLIPTYEKLKEIKSKLGMRVNGINLSTLKKQFPDIEFLRQETLEDAIDYIYDLTPKQIVSLIKQIENERENGIFLNSMNKNIRNFTFDIKIYGKPKSFSHMYDDNEKNLKALRLLKEANLWES